MKTRLKIIFIIIAICFESQINGQWTKLEDPFNGGAAVIIKTIGNRLYASSSNFSPEPNQLYESSDSEENWMVIYSISGYNAHFNQLASLGNILFIARTDSGIFRSMDSAQSWIQVFSGNDPNSNYCRMTVMDSILVVSIEGQLHQSVDTGTTWNLTYDATWHDPIQSLVSKKNNVYAGIDHALLRSTNSGINWSKIEFSDFTMGGFNRMVIIDSILIASNGSRVYESFDNGTSWINITYNLDPNPYKFCFGAYNNNLLISTQYGVFVKKFNSHTWLNANLGLGKTQVNAFDILGNFMYAATNSGIYRIDTSQLKTLPCDYIPVGAFTTGVPSCSSCSDGTATAYAKSGTPPYTYVWYTSPIQTSQTAVGLSKDYYSFCITDSLGCTGCDSIYVDNSTTITNVSEVCDDLFFHIYPNPIFDYLTVRLPSNISKSEIKIFNILGKLEYVTILITNETRLNLSDLKDGVYIVQIKSGDHIGRQTFLKQ